MYPRWCKAPLPVETKMTEVQATVEFSVELHKFYNVDLFQRGWVLSVFGKSNSMFSSWHESKMDFIHDMDFPRIYLSTFTMCYAKYCSTVLECFWRNPNKLCLAVCIREDQEVFSECPSQCRTLGNVVQTFRALTNALVQTVQNMQISTWLYFFRYVNLPLCFDNCCYYTTVIMEIKTIL